MLFKLLIFILSFLPNVSYNNIISKINSPIYPEITLNKIDKYSLNFISYTAFYKKDFQHIFDNIDAVFQWFLVMRYKGEHKNELWHKEMHNNMLCNTPLTSYNDISPSLERIDYHGTILLHIKTLGFFSTDIIFLTKYNKYRYNNNIVIFEMSKDKQYDSDKIVDFQMFTILLRHPKINNLVIAIIYGYIQAKYPADLISNQVKWHLDNILQNVGAR